MIWVPPPPVIKQVDLEGNARSRISREKKKNPRQTNVAPAWNKCFPDAP